MSEISSFQGEEWRLKVDNLLKLGRNFIETSNVGNQEEKQVLSDLLANVEANLSLLNGSRCDTREQLCDSENNHGVQCGIKHEHPEYFEDVPEDIKKSILIEKEKVKIKLYTFLPLIILCFVYKMLMSNNIFSYAHYQPKIRNSKIL